MQSYLEPPWTMSNLVCEGFHHVLLKYGYENAEWNAKKKKKKKKKIDDVTLQYSIHRSVQYGTTVDRPAAIGYKRSTFCNNFFSFRTLHPFQKILAIGLTVKFSQTKHLSIILAVNFQSCLYMTCTPGRGTIKFAVCTHTCGTTEMEENCCF